MSAGQKDQMHPQDIRNLFIFFILAIAVYFAYDLIVLKPQQEQLQRFKAAQQEVIEGNAAFQTQNDFLAEPLDRTEAIEATPRVSFQNEEISGSISLIGGFIDDIYLNHHFETLEQEKNVVLMSPRNTKYPRFMDMGWIAPQGLNITLPGDDTVWQAAGNVSNFGADETVTIFWESPEGIRFERDFSLDDHYVFEVTQRIINSQGEQISLFPYALISQTGLPRDLENAWIVHEGPMGFVGEELLEFSYSDMNKEPRRSYQADQGWVGITDKYWLSAIVPPQEEVTKYRFNSVYREREKGQRDQSLYQVDITGGSVNVQPGEAGEYTYHFFAGVKKVIQLNEYEDQIGMPNFDLAVDFGMFWFMTKPFFYALHYIGLAVGNFGVAIILLTIIMRMMVYPLTNMSFKSFANMKKVMPQIMELKKTYEHDRARLQQEMMELYQREGVNPMSGCLPILVQIPIFFALYKVLFGTIEMRHAPFFGWIQDLSAKDPTTIVNLFGLLDFVPPSYLHIFGIWPLMMLAVMLVQKKLNPPPTDPIQRDLYNFLPFVFGLMMSQFAAGLVIYWTFSGFISMLQQMYIMKKMGVPIHLLGETPDEPEPDPKEEEKAKAKSSEDDDMSDKAEEPAKPVSKPKPKKKKKKK